MLGLKDVGGGVYQYRGVTIKQNDRVRIGGVGRWTALTPSVLFRNLKEAVLVINEKLDGQPMRDWEQRLNAELIIRVGIQLRDYVAVVGQAGLETLFLIHPDATEACESINFDVPAFDYLFPDYPGECE